MFQWFLIFTAIKNQKMYMFINIKTAIFNITILVNMLPAFFQAGISNIKLLYFA